MRRRRKTSYVMKSGAESYVFIPSEEYFGMNKKRTYIPSRQILNKYKLKPKVIKIVMSKPGGFSPAILRDVYIRWKLFSGKRVDKTTRFAKIYGIRPIWYNECPALLVVQEMVKGKLARSWGDVPLNVRDLPIKDPLDNIIKTKKGFVIVDFLPEYDSVWKQIKRDVRHPPLKREWDEYYRQGVSLEELFTKHAKGFGHVPTHKLPDFLKKRITPAIPREFDERIRSYIRKQESPYSLRNSLVRNRYLGKLLMTGSPIKAYIHVFRDVVPLLEWERMSSKEKLVSSAYSAYEKSIQGIKRPITLLRSKIRKK